MRAGRRYLEPQREAKRTGWTTDELIPLYALECTEQAGWLATRECEPEIQ